MDQFLLSVQILLELTLSSQNQIAIKFHFWKGQFWDTDFKSTPAFMSTKMNLSTTNKEMFTQLANETCNDPHICVCIDSHYT